MEQPNNVSTTFSNVTNQIENKVTQLNVRTVELDFLVRFIENDVFCSSNNFITRWFQNMRNC